jgi:processive 1,2-diacylglycerol beta-glucosyltransferase
VTGAPRAFVLSGSIGSGHDVVAQVCAEALTGAGMEPQLFDCMALLGGVSSRLGEMAFRAMLSHPAIYDGFHFGQLRGGGAFTRHGDRAASRRIADRLEPELASYPQPVELLLSVFATGAAAGAELVERHPGLRSVVFCTDATAHAMWVHESTHLFITTSALAAATVRRYRPSARVAVVPPPVRSAFFATPARNTARSALALPHDQPCVLLTAGAWGVAPLAQSAAELADMGLSVLAVAGSNVALHHELDMVAACSPDIHVFGHTDRMHELMAACDVVISGPGQTCHEARVVGRPLVILDAVPGHGRENLLYELSQGGASAASPDPTSVRKVVAAVLKEPPDLDRWPIASAADWHRRFLKELEPLGLHLASVA